MTLFTPDDTVLLLIDHQLGTMSWIRSAGQEEVKANAMNDPAFGAAVKAAGRPNLVIAGVTNDVCTVYPTLTALQQVYRVQVVADAGGSMSKWGSPGPWPGNSARTTSPQT